jgi:CheY-like chemotaxis protein
MPLQPRVPTTPRERALTGANTQRRLEREFPNRPATPDLASRLWAGAAERMAARGLADARVLLVGFPPEHLSSLRESLRNLGVHVTAAASRVLQLPNVAEMGLAFSHVLVNVDAYEDVESGVDALAEFRASAPELVVVMCSMLVGGDDLGSERTLICDATLRLPVSMPRLRDGLLTATRNHDERGWRHRCSRGF